MVTVTRNYRWVCSHCGSPSEDTMEPSIKVRSLSESVALEKALNVAKERHQQVSPTCPNRNLLVWTTTKRPN
jgi:hypothetical protein